MDGDILRNGWARNPNQTGLLSEMDEKRSALYQRFASELIATALEDTPVVLVTGFRQCGKTTGKDEYYGAARGLPWRGPDLPKPLDN
jgi:predicted AAA+ superfamily ATPase